MVQERFVVVARKYRDQKKHDFIEKCRRFMIYSILWVLKWWTCSEKRCKKLTDRTPRRQSPG
jgi:hypothetical protein